MCIDTNTYDSILRGAKNLKSKKLNQKSSLHSKTGCYVCVLIAFIDAYLYNLLDVLYNTYISRCWWSTIKMFFYYFYFIFQIWIQLLNSWIYNRMCIRGKRYLWLYAYIPLPDPLWSREIASLYGYRTPCWNKIICVSFSYISCSC